MSQQDIRRKRKANLFTNDLRSLMYAFGDVQYPYNESVAVLEDILQEYVIGICHEAHRVARTANRQKIKVDDFKFALRNDARKLGRVEELLVMQREINEARRTFDNTEGKNLSKSYVDKDDKPANDNSTASNNNKGDGDEDAPPQPRKVGRPKKYKKREKKDKDE